MVTFKQYLKQCLQDENFKKEWELISNDFINNETTVELAIEEALKLLEDLEPENIIKNKGIPFNSTTFSEIEFYEENNKCPVLDFINDTLGSNNKLKAKVLKDISLLAVLGYTAKYPLVKYIGDGIYELRSKQGSNISRIFYFFVIGNKIIMTNGYIKKSQKLDNNEFDRAKWYMKNYLNNRVNK